MWDELVSTESILVGQGDLVPFYDQKVQKYIDRNAERIAGDFQMISTVQELKEFLYGEIRSLIKSDPIFRAPFEKELLERANQKDAVQALKGDCRSSVRFQCQDLAGCQRRFLRRAGSDGAASAG